MTTYDYHVSMKRVGIAELKAHLSQHLRSVRRGHPIVVMDRDTPIAKLTPYETETAPLAVRHAVSTLHSVSLPPALDKSVDSLAALLEERQSER